PTPEGEHSAKHVVHLRHSLLVHLPQSVPDPVGQVAPGEGVSLMPHSSTTKPRSVSHRTSAVVSPSASISVTVAPTRQSAYRWCAALPGFFGFGATEATLRGSFRATAGPRARGDFSVFSLFVTGSIA